MNRIYRRPTQLSGTPKKKKNEKNRTRNTIMNFRVSPLEKQPIDARIRTIGMSRSRFFIESCLYQTILVKGNSRTFGCLRNQMREIYDVFIMDPDLGKLDPEHAEALRAILDILYSLYGKGC